MIAIEFASDDDACLVLKALAAEEQAAIYLRPSLEAIAETDDAPGQSAELARLLVPPELEGAVRDLAQDIPAVRQAALRAYAERRRWQIEVGGVMISGIPVRTDEESQRKILGAYVAATRNPSWSTLWDSIHPVDAEAMISIGDAVQVHINRSFIRRGAIFNAIDTGAIISEAAIDAAFEAEP